MIYLFKPIACIKFKIILTFFLTCCYLSVFSNRLDSIHLKTAKTFLDNNENHRVLAYCDSIKKVITTTNTVLWSDFLNVEANAKRRVGNLEHALLLHYKVLSIRLYLNGSNSMPVANTYHNIGNCLLDSQQPDKAIK